MKDVSLIGLGLGNPGLLTQDARDALARADLILGASRMLDALPEDIEAAKAEAIHADDIVRLLDEREEWGHACIVLSGDIGLFSGAKRLYAALGTCYLVKTFPGISSVQYFAAKLRRPWEDWSFLSAHGKNCDLLTELEKGGVVFLVTDRNNTVGTLCGTLCDAGYGKTAVAVGEKLSYPDEAIHEGSAADFAGKESVGLSVMIVGPLPKKGIRPLAGDDAWPWANVGISDDSFIRGKSPMTKQEIRSVALTKLKVARTDVIYDVGAGTGSVAVELALLAREGTVFAIEHNEDACALIDKNVAAFNLTNIHVVKGLAPWSLKGLPRPDAVFVGGSHGYLSDILDAIRKVNPSARVCIACITLESLGEAFRTLSSNAYAHLEICQVSVSRAQKAGDYNLLKANNPVFLLSAKGVSQC